MLSMMRLIVLRIQKEYTAKEEERCLERDSYLEEADLVCWGG